ncbi:MAG TPA: glycosyltransferase family 4 protein [Chitinispirillaceae bacterium]|nr:glycosyltransferase family 4 protein [Chitinispirillaceae bacterium]
MLITENKYRELERILMTVDTVGGVWNYAIELIKGMNNHGIDVAVATMGPLPDSEKRNQLAGFKNVELFESNFKLEWMDEPWNDVEEATEWLLDLEIMTHPDIVHLNGFVHGALPWHSPVVVVGHSCISSWYENVKGERLPLNRLYYHKRVCEGLNAADFVIAPSNAMLDMLKNHYGICGRSKVIYNGKNGECSGNVKQKLILSAGRVWDEAKNMMALINIAPEIPWPVYIAGDCADRKIYSENVNFLGWVASDSLMSWMSRAAIYVSPAKYEPFGLSILEAAINECALILGDIDSLKEIWADAAIFVNPNDYESIKSTIKEMIKNERMRLHYGKKARQRSLNFSSEIMVENYIGLYKSLLKKDVEVI